MTKLTQNEVVPIVDQLSHFKHYLEVNDRCIFSAAFGDGKSYFLNQFCKTNNRDYVFITIYPLNYQIACEADILKYIKEDILLQLLTRYDIEFTKKDLSGYDIYKYFTGEKYDFGKDLFDCFSLSVFNHIDIVPSKLKRLFDNIKKLRKCQGKAKKSGDLVELINSHREDQVLYEFDAITQLINSIITKHVHAGRRKAVLIIEDLDRLDPGQIFRILNVLSVDINSSRGLSAEVVNKFGFDKVILVCDIENIKGIYHHLYGQQADFNGYISKFSSSPSFSFSLKDGMSRYIEAMMDPVLIKYPKVASHLAKCISNNFLAVNKHNKISMRDIKMILSERDYPSINVDKVRINCDEDLYIPRLNAFTKLLYAIDKLNISFDVFYQSIPREELPFFYQLVGLCWLTGEGDSIALKYDIESGNVSVVSSTINDFAIKLDSASISEPFLNGDFTIDSICKLKNSYQSVFTILPNLINEICSAINGCHIRTPQFFVAKDGLLTIVQ